MEFAWVTAVAVLREWDWLLLRGYGAGMMALGVIGLAMCRVGAHQFWSAATEHPGSILFDWKLKPFSSRRSRDNAVPI